MEYFGGSLEVYWEVRWHEKHANRLWRDSGKGKLTLEEAQALYNKWIADYDVQILVCSVTKEVEDRVE